MKRFYIFFASMMISSLGFASTATAILQFTKDKHKEKSAGVVLISETPYGLLFVPRLHSLTPGLHGFHIHTEASCAKEGMSAGGHLDPKKTGKHLGPYQQGHLGDLPVLYVKQDGTASTPVLAPRLHQLSEINHRALIIHQGGDNYADEPEKLGGGGNRIACSILNL